MPRRSLISAVILAALASAAAHADPVADFYKGKQIQFIIRSGVGGGYDQYSRLLAHYIGKHIPGNPTVIPVNMPGGGGIVAANYVANVAPKDGTIFTMTSNGLPTDQALGLNKSLKARPQNLQLGRQYGRFESGSRGLVHVEDQEPGRCQAARNHLRHDRRRLDHGAIAGALQQYPRHEIQDHLRLSGWSVDNAPWSVANSRPPTMPGRPTRLSRRNMWREKDHSNHSGWFEEGTRPPRRADADRPGDKSARARHARLYVAVGCSRRPVATTPGVPADRVAALRKAFDDTFKDPGFISDVAAEKADVRFMSGADLAQLVSSLIDAPQDLRDRVKQAIQSNTAEEFKGAKKKSGDD